MMIAKATIFYRQTDVFEHEISSANDWSGVWLNARSLSPSFEEVTSCDGSSCWYSAGLS